MLNGTRTVTRGWTAAIMISLLVIAAVAVAVCADESDGDTSASLSYYDTENGPLMMYSPVDYEEGSTFYMSVIVEGNDLVDSIGGRINCWDGVISAFLTEPLSEDDVCFVTIGTGSGTADVLDAVFVNGDVSIDSIDVDTEMDVGDTAPLSVTTTPAALADLVEVTYSSDEPGIVSVSDGTVTAESGGTATITATIEVNGTTYSQKVTIAVGGSVVPGVPVTGVSLDKTSASLNVGGTVTLTATVSPSEATNKGVTWESSNPSIATVVNGMVTAVSGGTATITVTTVDGGHTATCEVTVTEDTIKVTGVTLDKSEMTLFTDGVTGELTATVSPSNATNKDVTWKSSNPSVATVDENGVVTPVSAGTATITVTTVDGEFTASCTVTVEDVVPERIYVEPDKTVYEIGEAFDDGMTVTLVYNNGTTEFLNPEEYKVVTDFDSEVPGTYTVTVTYQSLESFTYDVVVRAPGQVAITVNVVGGGLFGVAVLSWGDESRTITTYGTILVDEGTQVTLSCDGLFPPTVTVDGQLIEGDYTFPAVKDMTFMVVFPTDDDDDDEPVNPSTPVQDGDDDSTTYIVAIAAAAVVAILAALILMQTRKS